MRSGALASSTNPKPRSKTVVTPKGIGQLPDDKPVVHKILTEGEKNNYTGVAKKGKVCATLQEHLRGGKNHAPGAIYIERMNSIQQSQQKTDRIIKRGVPNYNKPVK